MRIIFCLCCGHRMQGDRIDNKTLCPNCWSGQLSFVNPKGKEIPNGLKESEVYGEWH